MSRKSEAKQARRRKRQAARGVDRVPAADAGESNGIAEAVTRFNAWMVGRGWVLDEQNATDDVVSWVYPPSAADVDGDCEPLTRVWIALSEDDEAVTLEFGAVLVGADGDEGIYLLDPDALPEHIGVLEGYRLGESWLSLD